MRLHMERQVVLQAMLQCRGVVNDKSTSPILKNVLLEAADGKLLLTATDREVAVKLAIDAQVAEEGATTVSARNLCDMLRELGDTKDVEFSVNEGFMHLRGGRSRLKLATLPADEYPALKLDQASASVALDAQLLADGIAATEFSISNDETRPYLTGMYFDFDGNGNLNLVTTDSHRLSLHSIVIAEDATASCIVPLKAVREMRKMAEEAGGVVLLEVSERMVVVRSGANVLTSKVIAGRFPEYRKVLPSHDTYCDIDRIGLDYALRRAMIVANDITHDVRMQFTANAVQISASNSNQEEVDETVEASYNGDEAIVGFNGRYLRDVLGVIKSSKVRFHLRDGQSPVLISEPGNETGKYVIMPMRL